MLRVDARRGDIIHHLLKSDIQYLHLMQDCTCGQWNWNRPLKQLSSSRKSSSVASKFHKAPVPQRNSMSLQHTACYGICIHSVLKQPVVKCVLSCTWIWIVVFFQVFIVWHGPNQWHYFGVCTRVYVSVFVVKISFVAVSEKLQVETCFLLFLVHISRSWHIISLIIFVNVFMSW